MLIDGGAAICHALTGGNQLIARAGKHIGHHALPLLTQSLHAHLQAYLGTQDALILLAFQSHSGVRRLRASRQCVAHLAAERHRLLKGHAMLGVYQRPSRHARGMAHRQINRARHRRAAVRAANDILHPRVRSRKQGFVHLQGRSQLKLAAYQPAALAPAHALLQLQCLGQHLRAVLLHLRHRVHLPRRVRLRRHVHLRTQQQAPIKHPRGRAGNLAMRRIGRAALAGRDGQDAGKIAAALGAAHARQISLGVQGAKIHPAADRQPIAHGLGLGRLGLRLGIKQTHLIPQPAGQRRLGLYGKLLRRGPQLHAALDKLLFHAHTHFLLPPFLHSSYSKPPYNMPAHSFCAKKGRLFARNDPIFCLSLDSGVQT